MNFITRIRAFLENCVEEMKKCTWPNRDQLIESTLLVIVSLVILAAFVAGVDFILIKVIRWLTLV